MSHPEHIEYEALIDAYLLGRLNAEETERFEKHYFGCPECFRLTAERAALIDGVKAAGPAADAGKAPERTGLRRFPFRWAAVGAAALLAVAAVVLLIPRPSRTPEFPDSGIRVVRGEALLPVEPAGALPKAPERFAWHPLDGAAEYMVIVEGIDPAWTAQTRDTAIKTPTEIVGRMVPGKLYAWRVKAFSAEGTLLATSDEIPFSIAR
ncbi:MAG: anti-sigma factor family protein [Candidatus Aminicenantales bacterium]